MLVKQSLSSWGRDAFTFASKWKQKLSMFDLYGITALLSLQTLRSGAELQRRLGGGRWRIIEAKSSLKHKEKLSSKLLAFFTLCLLNCLSPRHKSARTLGVGQEAKPPETERMEAHACEVNLT